MLVHSSPTGRVRKVRSSKTPQLLGEFKDSKNGGRGFLRELLFRKAGCSREFDQ